MILVITADWFREKVLAESLRGFEVRICRDAYEALEQTRGAELIFLDADLPAANGIALVHELASDAPSAQIPIVLLADYVPEIDLALYNIDSVLTMRQLEPERLRRLTERIIGVGKCRA